MKQQYLTHQHLLLFLLIGSIICNTTTWGQTNTTTVIPESNLFETNSYWNVVSINPSLYETPYKVSLFSPENGEDGARLWSQSKSLLFYGLGVALVLAVMPESSTGWDTDADLFGKWIDNVTEGPVWDQDNAIYNYVGHTYSGGVYYQIARKSGYRQWDSFVYTALMSSFFWEYGIEAFAETPSIQDLVVTPVLGWVYGEWAYQTELKIRTQNNNQVLGSKILGNISLFFLDPADSLGRGINSLVGREWIKAGTGYFSYTSTPPQKEGKKTEHTVYLNMSFPLTPPKKSDSKTLYQYAPQEDPVDTGIVGFSVGEGFAFLDNKWGVEDDFYTKATLGLYFTPAFSMRLAYAWNSFAIKNTKEKIRYENYSLDSQYYFFPKNKIRPFISGGFGEQMWDEDRNQKSFQLNGGLGVHWAVFKKLALQADWINYYSPEEDTYDQNITASLIYRFGGGEHDNW